MKASEEGKVEWVKLLLDAGVQVNVQSAECSVKLQVRKLYLGRCTQA